MAYWLILPVCLYVALAVVAVERRPYGISSVALAFMATCLSLITFAYFILGTTTERDHAETAAYIVVFTFQWVYLLALPLMLLSLHFETWFQIHASRLFKAGLLPLVMANTILLLLMLNSSDPLVYQAGGHFRIHFVIASARSSFLHGTAFVLLTQWPFLLALGITLYTRRIRTWQAALMFLAVSVFSATAQLTAASIESEWRNAASVLSFLPAMLLFIALVLRAARRKTFNSTLLNRLAAPDDGIIVIDSKGFVQWNNQLMFQWQSSSAAPAAAPVHILQMLRDTPVYTAVKAMFSGHTTTAECELSLNNEPYLLQIERQPVADSSELPDAEVFIFRNVTSSRMRRNLDVMSREIQALSSISADISSLLDVNQVINRALQEVLAVTKLDDTFVYLHDPADPENLKLGGSLVMSPKGFAPETKSIHATNAGEVFSTGKTIYTEDADQVPVRGERLKSQGLRAGITVPLITRDRVIGVLQVGSQVPHQFEPIQIVLLESVGRQLAIAIDNARLLEEEREQRRVAEALREVSSILNNKNLDDALHGMLAQLRRLLDYERGTVLLPAEPGLLRVCAHRGLRNPENEDFERKRIALQNFPYLQNVFIERKFKYVPDTLADPMWVTGEKDLRSWLAVPLLMRDQVLGCLSLGHTQPNRFSPEDIQMAVTFGDQVAIAVENHLLFENELHRRLHAEFLQQASYDLVTSPDLDRALSAALDWLSQILAFDRAHIGLIDETSNTWVFRARRPAQPSSSTQAVPLSEYPLIEQVCAEKRAMMVSDTREQSSWKSLRSISEEVRTWIGAPLIVRNRVIGVLNIDGFQPHCFTNEQFQTVQTFANQIAAAIENFRLLEEASSQNRVLQTLNTVLASSAEALTHDNLMSVLLERVVTTLGLTGGVLHLCEEKTGDLVLRAASQVSDALREKLARLPAGSGLPPLEDETSQFFSVPLVSHAKELGLLSLYQPAQPFSPDVRQLLMNIGQQLGIVLENALLFENTTRREALQTDLGRFSLTISAQLDCDTVMRLICHESRNVFGTQGAYIWLLENGQLIGTAASGIAAEKFGKNALDMADRHLLPVQVLHEWHTRYINAVHQTAALPAEFQALTQAQAAMAIPLLKADVPIGTLLLISAENPEAFADWQLEHGGLMGVQAALAIQNATLFDEIRRRLDQLRLVNEVGRYATAILSLQSLIEGVSQKLFETLHYSLIALWQVEEEHLFSPLFFKPGQIKPDVTSPHQAELEKLVEKAALVGDPIIQTISREINGQILHPSALAVPLIVADEVVGVLVVEREATEHILKEDLDVLEPMAAQLAISVSNARLFEKIRQQTIALEGRVSERTAEIRQQHERIEAILRSVADAVIVFDLGGQVVLTNPVARQLFDQYDLEMNLGARIKAMVDQTMKETEASTAEVSELGNAAVPAKPAQVFEGENLLGTVVVLRDISRLKELDRMKDAFVATVSHELRTPLANLKLYLSLLRQGRPERRASYQEVMEREVERLARLINELLTLSRLQSEHQNERAHIRNPIDLDTLIQTVVQDNLAQAESKREELHYEKISSPIPQIVGDSDQIVRALTNLIGNAINYTPEGGRILVRSRVENLEQINSEWVIIEVIDTGVGIPAEELPMIFDRFFRGSNVSVNTPGTGLGLAIIKEIVEMHGGSIHVESEVGRGSTFCLRLPALNKSEERVGENV